MKIEDVLELADYYYDGVKNRTARYFAEKLLALIEEYPILKDYYDYYPSSWSWRESFSKKIVLNTVTNLDAHICIGGLYLVGSTFFNPITDEKYYWLKVGKSTDLKKRMKAYSTHNPMLWKNSFLSLPTEKINICEQICHFTLESVSLSSAEDSKEWFSVSRETYLEICEKGFSYFLNSPHTEMNELFKKYTRA